VPVLSKEKRPCPSENTRKRRWSPPSKASGISFCQRFQEYLDQPTFKAVQDMFTWPRVLDEVRMTLGEPPKRSKKKAG